MTKDQESRSGAQDFRLPSTMNGPASLQDPCIASTKWSIVV
jgi:hypothetical protein